MSRKSSTTEVEDEETSLVIGIDFGTTFSGVSWALSSDSNNVAILSQWESNVARASDSDKVPTKLSYDQNRNLLSWGFDIDPEDRQVSWFKLLLTGSTKDTVQKHRVHPELVATMSFLDKDALDLASDYLSCLWKHTLEVLGTKIGESLVDVIKIKVVLTVPAIWDHQGQEMTRKAASNAGITTRPDTFLELVSEPEAASLATIQDRGTLQAGDTFVICDAGGGTVDLVSYKVEKTKPLRLIMCTEATGGLFGATFLDDAFEATVASMMGNRVYDALSAQSKKKLMEDWEHGVKRNFKHSDAEGKKWVLSIPGYRGPHRNAGYNESLQPGAVVLKTPQVKAIFHKVCPQIVALIQKQVQALHKFASAAPKAILLVGGFGENRYLLEEIKSAFPQLQVLQLNRAWSVISRGAVMWGLDEDIVRNHIARYNYGIVTRCNFIDWKHLQEDRIWCGVEGKWQANNQMKWYTLRGANIGKTDPIKNEFFWSLTEKNQLKDRPITIYYSEAADAPKRLAADVRKLCTLKPSFGEHIWDKLALRKNAHGEEYRVLSFELEMIASGGSLLWRVKYGGVEQGRIDVHAEYHLI